MKKRILYYFITAMTILLFFSMTNTFAAAKNVNVTLPSFKITLNGSEVNNSYSKYPFIVYKDITYFPMTFATSRFLGLETKWDAKTGLEINKTNISYPFEEYKTNQKNSTKYTASIPQFQIKINGKTINNSNTAYPLLNFRDITYFPLTWEYAVNEFGWDYHFDNTNGLVINSQNASPKQLDLVDYLNKENRQGSFIVHGNDIYYTGNNGAIYQAPLNNLKNYKKIYQLPTDEYMQPSFSHRDGKVILSYFTGTGRMQYEVVINPNGTTSEPVALGAFIAPEVSEEGYLLYKSGTFETEKYIYMATSNINIPNDPKRIYKQDKSTGKFTLVSEKTADNFKYRNGRLYFVSDDKKLYSLSLQDDTIRLESNGPIYLEKYDLLGNDIYYINANDQKVYKEGNPNPLNSGETGEQIQTIGNYVHITFGTTLNNSYRSIVYDQNGNIAYILPRAMAIVSADANKMTYYDTIDKKVYLVELK